MVSILIFCHKKKEADILHKLCGCCAALTGDEAQGNGSVWFVFGSTDGERYRTSLGPAHF